MVWGSGEECAAAVSQDSVYRYTEDGGSGRKEKVSRRALSRLGRFQLAPTARCIQRKCKTRARAKMCVVARVVVESVEKVEVSRWRM